MILRPQSWWFSTLRIGRGYFLTAVAAVPAAAIGLALSSKGFDRQSSILISIGLATLGGFALEGIFLWRVQGKARTALGVLSSQNAAGNTLVFDSNARLATTTLTLYVVAFSVHSPNSFAFQVSDVPAPTTSAVSQPIGP